jgi:prolipoprotein diacylglyceryltransferase
VAAVYLLLYPAWRFWAETFRGDERIRWHGLSVAQILSMALFLCGCALFWRTRSRPDATV